MCFHNFKTESSDWQLENLVELSSLQTWDRSHSFSLPLQSVTDGIGKVRIEDDCPCPSAGSRRRSPMGFQEAAGCDNHMCSYTGRIRSAYPARAISGTSTDHCSPQCHRH